MRIVCASVVVDIGVGVGRVPVCVVHVPFRIVQPAKLDGIKYIMYIHPLRQAHRHTHTQHTHTERRTKTLSNSTVCRLARLLGIASGTHSCSPS